MLLQRRRVQDGGGERWELGRNPRRHSDAPGADTPLPHSADADAPLPHSSGWDPDAVAHWPRYAGAHACR